MRSGITTYDVAIIGGGLGGLSLSIQLARKGYRVVLFEKEKYPFHKVCGEYISMESWPFLENLGVPLSAMHLPLIHELQLSSPSGNVFTTPLRQGGFGISRFCIDRRLADIAVNAGVALLQECRVDQVITEAEGFMIHYTSHHQSAMVSARLCCAAYGKRSNLDIRWQRSFTTLPASGIDNFIGVKYHIRTDWPQHRIGLHNFENGYCGISKVEGDHFCLCYLTTAANLRKSRNAIPLMEQEILSANPVLKNILRNSTTADGFPVTIAQVSFREKTQAEKEVLMIGDAAGMITPLCGNGMSMALHSSKMASLLLDECLRGKLSRSQMVARYRNQWSTEFGKRMAAGRTLQYFFGRKVLSNLFVSLFQSFPSLAAFTIRQTHGRPF
jgi:menaquinone-9 beta-reductase